MKRICYYHGTRNYRDHVSLGERGETSDEGGSGGGGSSGGDDDDGERRTKTSIIARLGSRSGPYSPRTRPPALRNPSPRARDRRSLAWTCS
ncbi:hypothetical protein PUN28_017427 [Cardiocondyla obscurior]|uniref:Uncharacterized protein n=1 Tax=Cardiocondyla obscurior TaxID=286306 RepID=A0AAW2ESK8_9HYME